MDDGTMSDDGSFTQETMCHLSGFHRWTTDFIGLSDLTIERPFLGSFGLIRETSLGLTCTWNVRGYTAC
jgi:hypothetical protein